jgi:hypothetical protein
MIESENLSETQRLIAQERFSEDARQAAATNRMLIQCLVLINGGGAIVALAFYGNHGDIDLRRALIPLIVLLFCLGVFAATFAGLYLRRTAQAGADLWDSRTEAATREQLLEQQRKQVVNNKRLLTGLIVASEICFLIASTILALSLV